MKYQYPTLEVSNKINYPETYIYIYIYTYIYIYPRPENVNIHLFKYPRMLNISSQLYKIICFFVTEEERRKGMIECQNEKEKN